MTMRLTLRTILIRELQKHDIYGFDPEHQAQPQTAQFHLVTRVADDSEGHRQYILCVDILELEDPNNLDPGVPEGWDWEVVNPDGGSVIPTFYSGNTGYNSGVPKEGELMDGLTLSHIVFGSADELGDAVDAPYYISLNFRDISGNLTVETFPVDCMNPETLQCIGRELVKLVDSGTTINYLFDNGLSLEFSCYG